MILNDLYQSKLGLEAPQFSTNSLKLLSKCWIFWTDRAILATLSGRYAILVYNAIYDRVSRYGPYKRVYITYFSDENHQTSQTYLKIMLCLFIDLLIKSGSFCPKQCAISCANHRKNLKRNLIQLPLAVEFNSNGRFKTLACTKNYKNFLERNWSLVKRQLQTYF